MPIAEISHFHNHNKSLLSIVVAPYMQYMQYMQYLATELTFHNLLLALLLILRRSVFGEYSLFIWTQIPFNIFCNNWSQTNEVITFSNGDPLSNSSLRLCSQLRKLEYALRNKTILRDFILNSKIVHEFFKTQLLQDVKITAHACAVVARIPLSK